MCPVSSHIPHTLKLSPDSLSWMRSTTDAGDREGLTGCSTKFPLTGKSTRGWEVSRLTCLEGPAEGREEERDVGEESPRHDCVGVRALLLLQTSAPCQEDFTDHILLVLSSSSSLSPLSHITLLVKRPAGSKFQNCNFIFFLNFHIFKGSNSR